MTAQAQPATPAPATPGVKLTRRDVLWSWLLWTFFSHACYNYERLQGQAFAHAMTPMIRRLYKTPDEIRAALKRHLVFFNTEPNVGGVIHGSVLAMEEQRANGADIDDEAINSVKSGLMGPLAGIGDTISQGTITPILLALGIGIAGLTSIAAGETPDLGNLQGNPLGAIVYMVLETAIILTIGYFAYTQGYYRGRGFVTDILRSGVMDRVITGASVLGNLVLGALAATFVAVYIAVPINVGATNLNIQTDILDRIFPGFLGLGLVLLTWWLLRRGVSPITLLVAYLVIAIVGSIPFFGPAPTFVTDQCGSAIFQPYGPCTPPAPAS
jgi:PTS system mannose-specific IID component